MAMQEHADTTNWTGALARAFVENRPLALLVIVVSVVMGGLGFFATPKQYNPAITRPAFIVAVEYPGATVDEAYRLVATELVEKVTALHGVDEVTVSVRDGAQVVATVIFDVGFGKDAAKVSLQTQLSQHSSLARGAIRYPSVRELNPDEVPILTVQLTHEGMSREALRGHAVTISHLLQNVPDVAVVDVHGGHPPALVVELIPEELARTGVSVGQVLEVVRDASTEFPRVSVRDGTRQVVLDLRHAAVTPESLGSVGVSDTVQVGDVARIYRGTSEVSSYVRVAHGDATFKDAILLSVAKREAASAPVVSKAARDALDSILVHAPYEGFSYTVMNDDGVMASAEISGLMRNLVTSVAIVCVILMLFLSFRSALVVALSIPLTMLIVFAFGYLAGQTVNRITLFALILSLGLLVDAAIVIVEAVYASRASGLSREERARRVVRAVNGVGVGLFLSMVTSVIVFLPMRFITGMMGPYMGPIAFFVPMALMVSFVVAVTVMPYLTLALARGDESLSRVSAVCERGMHALTARYAGVLLWILRSRRNQARVLVGAGVAFGIALLIPVLQLVHFQMLPKADRDQYYVHVDMPTGTDVLLTKEVAEQVAGVIRVDGEVESVQLFVAEAPVLDFNGMFKGAHLRAAPHQATLRVNLTPANARPHASTEIVERARARYRESGLAGAVEYVRFVEDPPGPPVAATFVAKVSGVDAERRDAVAQGIFSMVQGVPGVVDADVSMRSAYPRMELAVDHGAMHAYGVAPAELFATLGLLGAPFHAGQYHSPEAHEFAPVEVRLPRDAKEAPSDLSYLTVRSREGVAVPLLTLVDTEYVADRESLLTEGTVPLRYVSAETEGRPILYVMLDVMRELRTEGVAGMEVVSWSLFGMTLVNDVGGKVEVRWGGEWEMTLENFRDLGLAMMAALFLVYLVLVAQYKNFKTPGLILVTVPLGLVGILVGFAVLDALAGIPITATALIGFIALIGIVVNNAIILLERFAEAEKEGATFEKALQDAATSRMRPILLTSLTTILGSLTIASDPVWSGLAWAIVFGLSLSTALTLVVLPTLLAYTRAQHVG